MRSLFDAADCKSEMAEKDEDLQIPRDAKIIKSLLQSIGIEEYEPRVVHHMLELWYKYAGDVLTDAQLYSEHAGKGLIDSDDIKLAIQSRVNFTFSQPPPRGVSWLEAGVWFLLSLIMLLLFFPSYDAWSTLLRSFP